MKKLNLSSERLHFIMYEEVPLHTPMKPARGYKPKVESNLTDTNYRKEESPNMDYGVNNEELLPGESEEYPHPETVSKRPRKYIRPYRVIGPYSQEHCQKLIEQAKGRESKWRNLLLQEGSLEETANDS